MSKKVRSDIRYEGDLADQTNMTQHRDMKDNRIESNGPAIIVRQSN